MTEQHPFKWRHVEAEIILLCVRWYVHYALSYRDLEELMRERGLQGDHTTIDRGGQRDTPELEKRCRRYRKGTTDSWRGDETSMKVKGVWMSLDRARDSQGNPVEFLLSATRDAPAAERFFAKAVSSFHIVTPRVITVDKHAASPKAVKEFKASGNFLSPVNCGRAHISTI